MTVVKPYRCAVCQHSIEQWERRGKIGCPKCGTMRELLLVAEDGFVRVNWQDLRLIIELAYKTVDRTSMHMIKEKREVRDEIIAFEQVVRNLTRFQPRGSRALYERKRRTQYLLEFNDRADMTVQADGTVPSPYYIKRPPTA